MTKNKLISRVNPLLLRGIAHRGLHNDVYTENGLKAFQNAIDHHLPFELDVHLTKDGKLIVCHDSELKRTTGKAGIIEEMTVDEIRQNYRLLDGETVPTFQEVLSLCQERVPIVVEMKVYQRNYRPLAKQLKQEMAHVKNKGNFMIISFDPRALVRMGHQGYIRSLLVTYSHKWTYSLRWLFESLDLEYGMVQERKVQRYQKKHFVNVWTIDSTEKFDASCPHCDTVTFQRMEDQYVVSALSKKKR
jgi:glycerophosphoryl diester phosphodiesterase